MRPVPALLLVTLLPFAGSARAAPSEASLEAARARVAAGDLAGAVALLEPMRAAATGGDDALILLGSLDLRLGRVEEALAALAPVVEREDAPAEALFVAAGAVLALGRREEAERYLALSAARAPISQAALMLAALLEEEGRKEDLVAILRPMVEGEKAGALRRANPELADQLVFRYGRTLVGLGRSQASVGWLREATQRAPENREAWQLLGEALVDLGRVDEARAALSRAQELEEGQHAAESRAATGQAVLVEAMEKAYADHEAGRLDEALQELRKAVELAPADPRPRRLELRLLLEMGRPAEAQDRADRLVEIAPEDPGAIYLRGLARLGGGDPAGAEADFRRALVLAPGDLSAGNGLAMALLGEGRRDEARAVVLDILRRAPDDPTARRTARRLEGSTPEGAPRLTPPSR